MTPTLEKLKTDLAKYKADRDRIYKSVQDMSVSATKTDQAMKELAQYKTLIESTERAIKKLESDQESISDVMEKKRKWILS